MKSRSNPTLSSHIGSTLFKTIHIFWSERQFQSHPVSRVATQELCWPANSVSLLDGYPMHRKTKSMAIKTTEDYRRIKLRRNHERVLSKFSPYIRKLVFHPIVKVCQVVERRTKEKQGERERNRKMYMRKQKSVGEIDFFANGIFLFFFISFLSCDKCRYEYENRNWCYLLDPAIARRMIKKLSLFFCGYLTLGISCAHTVCISTHSQSILCSLWRCVHSRHVQPLSCDTNAKPIRWVLHFSICNCPKCGIIFVWRYILPEWKNTTKLRNPNNHFVESSKEHQLTARSCISMLRCENVSFEVK